MLNGRPVAKPGGPFSRLETGTPGTGTDTPGTTTVGTVDMVEPRLGLPNLGLGIGLRTVHYNDILGHWPPVDWFEIISENYMDSHGRPWYVLDQISERYPIVMHGVSLSIGSSDALNFEYLKRLKALAAQIKAVWVSDHVCWTGVAGCNSHDLLPVPMNEQTLKHMIEKVRDVQDFLERPLILENPSSYLAFADSTMPEWEFISRIVEATECGLLLDVNNVYVSSVNHEFDPEFYLRSIPHEHVVQFHVAGHTNLGTHIIDTHDGHVIDRVWELFRLAYQLTGGASPLLEWDAQIPEFSVVHAEILKAQKYIDGEAVDFSSDEASAPARADGHSETVPHPASFVRAEVE